MQTGPVAQLRLGGSGLGDALIGFRQGEPGHFQIVADRVSAPPQRFRVKAPKHWVKPRRVKLSWERLPSAVGGVTYSVLIGGQVVKRGLRRNKLHLRPGLLGNGSSAPG